MRNKITCTAQKLSQLEPYMIQSVVAESVFKLGRQYMSEDRVRIREADDSQISAFVMGNTGVHEQSIRLRGDSLVTKCTCTSDEMPFCRHCAAVLLEYHRWAQPPLHESHARPEPAADQVPDRQAESKPLSAADFKLRELTVFVEWMQSAMKALEGGQPMPVLSGVGPGEVLSWAQAIQKLEERWRWSRDKRVQLETELNEREAQFDEITERLNAAAREVRAVLESRDAMEQELTAAREKLRHVHEVEQERDRLEHRLTNIRGDLAGKRVELETLASSLRQISATLDGLAPC